MRRLFSQPICAYDKRNGLPSANQGVSKVEPRHGHAVRTLWLHPPSSSCPALSAHTEPISKDVVSLDEIFMIDISGYIRESVKSCATFV